MMKSKRLRLGLFLIISSIGVSATAEKAKLFVDNREAAKLRIEMITHAKSEILAEYFEVDDDRLAMAGLSLIKQMADANPNLKVRILLDWKYNQLSPAMLAALTGSPHTQTSNIQIKYFNIFDLLNPFSLTYRTHEKLFVVDGREMVVGSRNVSTQYFGQAVAPARNFRDVDVYIADGKAAQDAQQYFHNLWDKNPDLGSLDLGFYSDSFLNRPCRFVVVGTDVAPEAGCVARKKGYSDEIAKSAAILKNASNDPSAQEFMAEIKKKSVLEDLIDVDNVVFQYNDPTLKMSDQTNSIGDKLFQFISNNAGESLTILTPYLFPLESELQIIENMIKEKNVHVKIVTNSMQSTDGNLIQAGYELIRQRLISMGIELYEYQGPEIEHAKVGLMVDKDGRRASLIGSYNLDQRSAQLNREVGVVVFEKAPYALATQLDQAINRFIDNGKSLLVGKDKVELNSDLRMQRMSQQQRDDLQNSMTLLKNFPFLKTQL